MKSPSDYIISIIKLKEAEHSPVRSRTNKRREEISLTGVKSPSSWPITHNKCRGKRNNPVRGKRTMGFTTRKQQMHLSMSSTHKGVSSRVTLTQQGGHYAHQPRAGTQLHGRAAPELHSSHLQIRGKNDSLSQNTG